MSLRWRNGDLLDGKLLEGGAGKVRFSAPLFAGPLELASGQLESIRFPAGEPDGSDGDGAVFEVTLKNGDRLRGVLVSVDDAHIVFRCAPLSAPVAIRRDKALRLSRIASGGHGLADLGDPGEWTSTGRERKPSDWFTGVRGELSTHQWSGNLFREIELPEKVEIRFRARFPAGRPNVQVGFLRDPQNGPMLETWDDHLVLTHRTRFAQVMKLGEATREIQLRLFWDQASGRTVVCDPSGKELASLQGTTGPENPDRSRRLSDPLRRGFSILSRNPEMNFVSLEIRPWDGTAVPLIDLTRPRLQWKDGPGKVGSTPLTLPPGSNRLQLGRETRSLADLMEWVISPESDAPGNGTFAAEPSTRIAWNSGTSIGGDFVRIGPDLLELLPAWSETPVLASLSGAREIRFPENTEALLSGKDTLKAAAITLRGTVRLAPPMPGETSSLIAWQPPGAVDAVALAPGADLTIVRGSDADDPAGQAVGLDQARLYLRNEEILAGEMISFDTEKVVFTSRLTGRIEIPAREVRALDTGTSGRILEGFRDPGWEEIEEDADDVTFTPDSVTMRAGGFGNPSILLGDRILFEADWQETYGAMTVRLFASGPDAGNASTDVIIAAQGNRIFVGKLNENGAFSFTGDQIPIADNRASVEISARPEEVEIRINGKSALTMKVEPGHVSGNGIYFKMGGGWQGWNQPGCILVMNRFRIESSPGSIPLRIIDPRAKSQALGIPRPLREKPPTHLLVAPNGDILRGTLESADRATVRFHANGQSLSLPRDRVSTIVRLDPPVMPSTGAAPEDEGDAQANGPVPDAVDEDDERDDDEGTKRDADAAVREAALADERFRTLQGYRFKVSHSLVLRDGSRLRLDGKAVEDARLAGQSPVLGKCLVSLDQVRQIRLSPPLPLEETEPMDLAAFHDWRAVFMPDPVIPKAGEASASPMVGKEAPPIELTLLDDSTFRLADHRGKVVVLDFWATWCGPCIKAMPEVKDAVAAFPPGVVTLMTVNQGETPPLITPFLEARGWQDTPVALDFNMKVGDSYGVEGIPHTVVVDPEGKIAWVHSGFSPDLKQKLFEAVAKVLSR